MIATRFTIFSMYLRAMLDDNNCYCIVILIKLFQRRLRRNFSLT